MERDRGKGERGTERHRKHIIGGGETHGFSSVQENMHFFHSI